MLPQIDLPAIATEMRQTSFNQWFTNALIDAFIEARKNKLATKDEHDFELHIFQNILNLRDSVLNHFYEPGSSISFIIYEPMIREIFAAPFRDRIIHHFLYNMQAGWWDHRFIHNSYSCRKGKGTLFGIHQAHNMMRSITKNQSRDAFVAKFDLSGYFMSLDRQKLLERVLWGLERQFQPYLTRKSPKINLKDHQNISKLYHLCAYLWKKILLDDPVSKARKRGNPKNWDNVPDRKTLFKQPPGRGIVIGNLTSQLVSNIYLDQLDRFITYDLGYNYYGRYVDDFFIMFAPKQKRQFLKDIPKIEQFLKDQLGLTLHPDKRYLQSVYKGMTFIGAKIYPNSIQPSPRIISHYKTSMEQIISGQKSLDVLVSYLGLTKHLNAEKLNQQIFQDYGQEYEVS